MFQPSFVGAPNFVLRTGGTLFGRSAEPFPENTYDDVGIFDVQSRINEALWAFGMKAGVAVSLPSDDFQSQSPIRGNSRV
jgi:hypothetical protein